LLYAIDFGLKETRPMTYAAEFCEADTIVLENTYFKGKSYSAKRKRKRFIKSFLDTLDRLLLSFYNCQDQKILMLLYTM
jgi:Cft2 family RNA processing exonuclease